jgi:putative nucleotidyltransferase with HDIG domain
MAFNLSPDLLPEDPALLAHCRRVAAVSTVLAQELSLSDRQRHRLTAACLLHHHDSGLVSESFVDRLLTDIGNFRGGPRRVNPLPPSVRTVLAVFRHPRRRIDDVRTLAEILRAADTFDQEYEASPLEFQDIHGVFERLRAAADSGYLDGAVVGALTRATTEVRLGDPFSWQIPACPEAILQMTHLLQNSQINAVRVVEAAGEDPATAGKIIQLANSGLFGGDRLVSTLSQAVLRLGFATAWRVALSFAARPLLASPEDDGLWRHSVEVADLAEQLARKAGGVDPAEAYMAGLLHDVGRVALQAASAGDRARLRGLEQMGCPVVYSESLLLRTDHARLGACVAAAWGLPSPVVDAIQNHHCPEATSSRLAHLIYVAEYLNEAEEDLPSALRLECAARAVGVAVDEVSDLAVSTLGASMAAL